MTELSPDAENLIAQANGGDEPGAFDEQRVRRRIAAQLAAAAVTTATVATTPAQALPVSTLAAEAATGATSAGSAGSISATLNTGASGAVGAVGSVSVFSKLLLGLALSGGSAALGAHYLMEEPTGAARIQESTASENHRAESGAVPDYAPDSEIAAAKQQRPSSLRTGTRRDPSQGASTPNVTTPTTTSQAIASQTGTTQTAERSASRKAASAPAGSILNAAPQEEASVVVPSAVREEASLLRRARSALANGGAAEAQRLLRQHKRLFPQGALVEERTATQIMAECAHGRTARTDRRAAEFLSAYPLSPLASSVRQACSRGERQNDSHTDLPPAGH